jgi:cell division septal protein FtsQ
LRTFAAAVAVSAAAAGALWLAHTVVESAWLRVDRLVVSGTTRLTPEDVERLVAGIRLESVLRVDFSTYRRRLRESPWVADATLWRRLPSTVEIRVRERHPLALARVGHQLYLTDASGVIIDEYGPEYADIHVPIVIGLVSTPATPAGTLVDPERVRLMSSFLDAVSAWPSLRDRVSELDVSQPADLAVLLDGDPAWLHLGRERFLERLKTYVEVRPALDEQLGVLDSVDLRFDGRLFVRPRPEMHR